MTMDQLNESELAKEVSKYAVVFGFLLVAICVMPCIAFALLSKYCQKQPLKRKATYDFADQVSRRQQNTIRRRDSAENNTHTVEVHQDSTSFGAFGQFEMPVDKIKCVEKIGFMGVSLACSETWQAYAPPSLCKEDRLVMLRKLAATEGVKSPHGRCLKAELDVISHIPPHPHILNLLGVCTTGSNVTALLLEYPPYGSFHSFLIAKAKARASMDAGFWLQLRHSNLEAQCVLARSAPPTCLPEAVCDAAVRSRPFRAPLDEGFTEMDELIFALQVASGMEHLAKSGIFHRRLSTENILISMGFHLKLAGMEFETTLLHRSGSSRLKRTTSGRNLLKWEAPEVMYGDDPTMKSAVWQFGMTMWEVTSMGDTPFCDIPNRNLGELLKKGERPFRPQGTSQDYYNLMMDCWAFDPDHRPTFAEVVDRLRKIVLMGGSSQCKTELATKSRPITVMTTNRCFTMSSRSPSSSVGRSPSPNPFIDPNPSHLLLRKLSLRRVSATEVAVVDDSQSPNSPKSLPEGYVQTDV